MYRREKPAPEPRTGHDHGQEPDLSARTRNSGSRQERAGGLEEKDRVGKPDSVLRLSALYDGQRPSDGNKGYRRARRHGRGARTFHQSVSSRTGRNRKQLIRTVGDGSMPSPLVLCLNDTSLISSSSAAAPPGCLMRSRWRIMAR